MFLLCSYNTYIQKITLNRKETCKLTIIIQNTQNMKMQCQNYNCSKHTDFKQIKNSLELTFSAHLYGLAGIYF